MYGVFDSTGTLVRGRFAKLQDAYNWKFVNGNSPNWRVKEY